MRAHDRETPAGAGRWRVGAVLIALVATVSSCGERSAHRSEMPPGSNSSTTASTFASAASTSSAIPALSTDQSPPDASDDVKPGSMEDTVNERAIALSRTAATSESLGLPPLIAPIAEALPERPM